MLFKDLHSLIYTLITAATSIQSRVSTSQTTDATATKQQGQTLFITSCANLVLGCFDKTHPTTCLEAKSRTLAK
jgi:hypothetical protein